MPASFSHRLNSGAVQAMLKAPNGGVARELLRRGLLVETQAKRNLGGVGGPKRIDTGRLRSSIATQLVTRDGAPAVLIGTNVFYAKWIHDGTGVHGPRHTRIVPVRAKFLRFRPKGSRTFVYRRSVAGMVRNQFLKNALAAARG
jgi:hypothetical protein